MAFLLSLFFGICVFATVCMMFQHYGLVHEQPRPARTEPLIGARSSPLPAADKQKKGGFSLFGAIAGLFASLRGEKDTPKEMAPVKPLGVNPTPSAQQPVRPLGVSSATPEPQLAAPLAAGSVAAVTQSAKPEEPKPAETKSRLCPKCGTEILDDAAFCWQCGGKIAEPVPADEADKKAPAQTFTEKTDEAAKDVVAKTDEIAKDVLPKAEETAKEENES